LAQGSERRPPPAKPPPKFQRFRDDGLEKGDDREKRKKGEAKPLASPPFSSLPFSLRTGFWVAGAVLLGAAVAAGWIIFGPGEDKKKQERVEEAGPKEKTDDRSNPRPKTKPWKKPKKSTGQKKTKYPRLYQPRKPLDLARLRKEYRAPPPVAIPASARRVRVSRSAVADADTFPSLAEACRATGAAKDVVIEVRDNGPLFEKPVEVTGRNLVVRAGKGFRPLIAWDGGVGRPAAPPRLKNPGQKDKNQNHKGACCLLAVDHGSLTLEGLDVVVKGETPGAAKPAALFRVTGGHFAARQCTFSVAGKHPHGVAVLQQLGTPPGDQTPPSWNCLFSRCFARGTALTALNLKSPGGKVLLDRCLLVGGGPPLLRVAGSDRAATTLLVFRSTLVAGKNLLEVNAATAADKTPEVRWHGWDALLAQGNAQVDGDLVALAGGLKANKLRWEAVNCLYAGWKRLLAGKEEIAGTDLDVWQKRWRRTEGDKAIVPTWPKDAPPEPEEASYRAYRTPETDAGFAATSGPGTLGCDVDALLEDGPAWLTARKSWLGVTYQRFLTAPPSLPEDSSPPEVPSPDGSYTGALIDVGKENLGRRVRELSQGLKPGSKLVLRLSGSGLCPTDPLRVQGIHLSLYFETPSPSGSSKKKKKGKATDQGPVLVPHLATAVNRNALIEVEGGTLEMVGCRIRFSNSSLAKLPRYMLQVKNGDLRLFRCRLEGPLTEAPPAYRGLVHLIGSGKADPEKTPAGVVNESVLISGRTVVHLAGTGARLYLRRSLVVAGGDAIHLDPGSTARPPLVVQCLLEQNTVAVKGAVLYLGDAPKLRPPFEPMIVQADNNLFLDPFTELPHQGCLLRYDGEALPRGLLLWQGGGNGYDSRLHASVVAAGVSQAKPRALPWEQLWGHSGEKTPRPLDFSRFKSAAFSLEKLQLPRLVLPPLLRPRRGQPPLGADLKALGILVKKR
jgi:hypothetical protein